MTETSARSAYSQEFFVHMEFESGSTRNEGSALWNLEPSKQTNTVPDLNYIGVDVTTESKEKTHVLCLWTVNEQVFLDQF